MTNISADYQGMENVARNISNSASEYITNIEEVYRIISNLESNWKGVDNIAYVNKANEYKKDLEALGEAINNYGMFLSQAAQVTSRTQEDIRAGAGRF